MTIDKTREGASLRVALGGKLDTTTAPELAAALSDEFEGLQELVFDMTALDYVSSAGLRELFSCQKKMNGLRGRMSIRGCTEDVLEIFDITGFTDLLNIE